MSTSDREVRDEVMIGTEKTRESKSLISGERSIRE